MIIADLTQTFGGGGLFIFYLFIYFGDLAFALGSRAVAIREKKNEKKNKTNKKKPKQKKTRVSVKLLY